MDNQILSYKAVMDNTKDIEAHSRRFEAIKNTQSDFIKHVKKLEQKIIELEKKINWQIYHTN